MLPKLYTKQNDTIVYQNYILNKMIILLQMQAFFTGSKDLLYMYNMLVSEIPIMKTKNDISTYLILLPVRTDITELA